MTPAYEGLRRGMQMNADVFYNNASLDPALPEQDRFANRRLIAAKDRKRRKEAAGAPVFSGQFSEFSSRPRRGRPAFAEDLPCFAMLRTAWRRGRQECGRGMPRPYE